MSGSDGAEPGNSSPEPEKKTEILSFKPLGRPQTRLTIRTEFEAMRDSLKKSFTAEVAQRIAEKSGTHLLKLISPRVGSDQAILRIDPQNKNHLDPLLPSTNAGDVPFCKVIFRPIEVEGYAAASVVDLIRNPDDRADWILEAFAEVFGADVLETLKTALTGPAPIPRKLAAGEFPIIFVPHPDGGDLQITPVSPAAAFMGIKRIKDYYFQPNPDGTPRPHPYWTQQAVSAKPQNISGAIGGPRLRLQARLPQMLSQSEAQLWRFLQGGSFPRLQDEDVTRLILLYAEKLEADRRFNNSDTRAALDRLADRLIDEAQAFIEATMREAAHLAQSQNFEAALPPAPRVTTVLIRRKWRNEKAFDAAQLALSGVHFTHRLSKLVSEDVP